jgi:hypothetical protein
MPIPHYRSAGFQSRLMQVLGQFVEANASANQSDYGSHPRQQRTVPRQLRAQHSQIDARVSRLFGIFPRFVGHLCFLLLFTSPDQCHLASNSVDGSNCDRAKPTRWP